MQNDVNRVTDAANPVYLFSSYANDQTVPPYGTSDPETCIITFAFQRGNTYKTTAIFCVYDYGTRKSTQLATESSTTQVSP